MASTAIHGLEAIADLDAVAEVVAGLDAVAAPDGGPDPSRSGPGTVIRSVFAGRRSGPSDAVLSGSPVGAAGDESSCCVSSSEKVLMRERGVCPLWRRPGGRAGRNPRKPHPAARRVTAQAR